MRISAIVAVPIKAARLVPMVATQGTVGTSEFGIVRVDTDDGITGWGEISMSWGRVGRALCHDVELILGPALLGRDPRDLADCTQAVNAFLPLPFDGAHAAKAALEMALLDITGKAYGIPVYRLLGGRARPAVPVAWPIPWGTVEASVDASMGAKAQGFRTVKLKIGRPGQLDREVVRAVRAAVGDDMVAGRLPRLGRSAAAGPPFPGRCRGRLARGEADGRAPCPRGRWFP